MIEDLIYWVKERQSITDKKAAGLPAPWTEDPIFQTYRFCNVRRKADRVSQWLIKNVLTDHNYHMNKRSFLEFSAFCRWVNWPLSIAKILEYKAFPQEEIDWLQIADIMDIYAKEGNKLWTGAYIIKSAREWKGKPKHYGIVNEVIVNGLKPQVDLLLSIMEGPSPTKFEVWRELKNIKYFGVFMAGQCVDDWTWTPLLNKATDIYTWAPQGPGSVRGFNRIMDRPLKTKIPMEEWLFQLKAWRQLIIDRLGPSFEDLTLMDCQSVLCETDKFLRVKYGEGRPRSKYRPETAY